MVCVLGNERHISSTVSSCCFVFSKAILKDSTSPTHDLQAALQIISLINLRRHKNEIPYCKPEVYPQCCVGHFDRDSRRNLQIDFRGPIRLIDYGTRLLDAVIACTHLLNSLGGVFRIWKRAHPCSCYVRRSAQSLDFAHFAVH
jgi:hypothetical protein